MPSMPWAAPPCMGSCGHASCGGGAKAGSEKMLVSRAEAVAALQHATEQGRLFGIEIGAGMAGDQLREQAEQLREQTEAAVASAVAAHDAALLQAAAQSNATVTVLASELQNAEAEMEAAIAEVTTAAVAAEKALEVRVSTLQQQLGGTNWLSAHSKVAQAQSEVKTLKAQSEADRAKLKELNDLLAVGPRLRAKGDELRRQLASGAEARTSMLHDELAAPMPDAAADVGLTERRVDQLVSHLEQQLFAGGAGEVGRTKLLAAALTKRPAVQRLLVRRDNRNEKLARAASEMLEHVKGVLEQLTTGVRGSRSLADHQRFETIVAALVPDGVSEDRLMSAIGGTVGCGPYPFGRED